MFTLFAIAMADTAAQKSVKNVHVLGKLEIELNTNIRRIFFFLAFAVDYRKLIAFAIAKQPSQGS